MKRLPVFPFIALSLLQAHRALASGAAPDPRAVAGCYAVTLGPWQPSPDMGEDAPFVTPPAHIELRSSKGTTGWAKGHYILLPARGASSLHNGLFWRFNEAGGLHLVFTTGFSGLTMALTSAGTNLRGTATTFWDFPRTPQTASVLATREPCQPR